jgi:hypothetical protein
VRRQIRRVWAWLFLRVSEDRTARPDPPEDPPTVALPRMLAALPRPYVYGVVDTRLVLTEVP